MAQAKSKATSDSGSATNHDKAGGKSRMVTIMMICLLLVAGGGGSGWFYFHSAHAKAEAVEAPKKHVPPVFVNLDTFTVNLADRDRYLQLGITYEVTGTESTASMKLHMPILRSKILLLLASKTSDDLGSTEGKTRLAEELVTQVRETLPVSAQDKGIAAVHFSAFVIQ